MGIKTRVGTSPTSAAHAQFEQLALRMSKLVVHESSEQSQPESTSVGEKTSATSSCAASAIFSVAPSTGYASGSGSGSDSDDEVDKAVVVTANGPSMLARTAPPVVPTAHPDPPAPTEPEDQVSVKIADLGNAARIGKHVTNDIQTRQYRSPEVILRKPWGPAVDIFSLGCVVFELLTGDFLFEPKAREPLWSRDDDHICQMHEALGPFTLSAAQGGSNSRSIFRSDGSLRNVPARKINMWPMDAVLRDKYEFAGRDVEEIDSFLRPMLALDDKERVEAREAARHPWLWS
ncbi:serine/threonine protein kinase, CMGC group [Ceratobasidium sp. 395]|nr:serine/threonine protein kinase, CMGC group [Ceratobasidium sp. 395]